MPNPLPIALDRSARTPLSEQIRKAIAAAIDNGVLVPGARLPSWLDLAAQLGVARGTVRAAYDRLADAQHIVSSKANGTTVAMRPRKAAKPDAPVVPGSVVEMFQDLSGQGIFRMGVPAQETLPAKLLARIRARAVRAELSAVTRTIDPRGEIELRREIAAHLAIARGIECSPAQIVITSGFSGGLGLALGVLGLEGRRAWLEDPGFPLTRKGLELARLEPVPIPVDANGIDVEHGLRHAPDAALAVVTPGQQAPLGPPLSLGRRAQLLDWAAQAGAWIIEDDYLGELQLDGRAAPALASLDPAGRVIHLGSFSKTISPTLRLGFLVAPEALAAQFADVATCLAPAPGPAVQLSTAEFMREGHYIRHLRRTKRAYCDSRDALTAALRTWSNDVRVAGLAVMLTLPDKADDVAIAREALAHGLAPAPLSPWYVSSKRAQPGLLLGIATVPDRGVQAACKRLFAAIRAQDRTHGAPASRRVRKPASR
ncbi:MULTISPECIES: PLP-dependent aminotransferase family protein [unclassified Bradyrhizobium]|uniref:MocR-like pyridoxine biosynthesis transcription factor PdxR n=1 Tax=unclassified Bradyrhizobium TaxID=2631580 RepID=UPI00048AF2E9|nr:MULTISPECIES: PLP-dependent aminotransferase family protein [unclassified Bradyrhizobium]QIG91302.1 PLP-dependent aminotransferase family protein [Bradyrhizobium sp. 6(2017)]